MSRDIWLAWRQARGVTLPLFVRESMLERVSENMRLVAAMRRRDYRDVGAEPEAWARDACDGGVYLWGAEDGEWAWWPRCIWRSADDAIAAAVDLGVVEAVEVDGGLDGEHLRVRLVRVTFTEFNSTVGYEVERVGPNDPRPAIECWELAWR